LQLSERAPDPSRSARGMALEFRFLAELTYPPASL
jgi:hypothetical protein